ncbi:MAG: hypothetical protein BJ554DRAFT_5283 [Olpidium bornovanus]|uniref:Uncharacterized protein n=1 Tax=Olpidium bornovanus TaxID=278681 RepID=A0A8H8DLM6_9FUNG|nr:MAG: hypothetical protein BJ554DRAFT_5283 [Olpidium bornovanus]
MCAFVPIFARVPGQHANPVRGRRRQIAQAWDTLRCIGQGDGASTDVAYKTKRCTTSFARDLQRDHCRGEPSSADARSDRYWPKCSEHACGRHPCFVTPRG